MNEKNLELLQQLAMNRLNMAINDAENQNAFNEAMNAIDRINNITKIQSELDKEELKLQYEKEANKIKQQFEKEILNTKQNFEAEMEESKQVHELERDSNKFKADAEQQSENRDLQRELEESKQLHEIRRDAINHENEIDKLKVEQKQANKDKNKDMLIKVLEVGATVIAAPLIEAGCKNAFAHMICEFEKDYSFSTLAGKSLSGLFKFKR